MRPDGVTDLYERIRERKAHVVVVGVGYVGLPLLAEIARAGFHVTGYDVDRERLRMLSAGESYIADVPSNDLLPHVRAGRLRASSDETVLGDADAVIICVPTPLNKTRDPDIRFIVQAADAVARHQRRDQLIVLESTSYPGTTREIVVPRLVAGGLELGRDVFVAFSPERVDPGNPVYNTRNTPKVISGATPRCLEVATALYSVMIEQLVPVSSLDTAEMVKLLENTFRAVNIGLVNELAIISRKLAVDPFAVIRAAATKPFGFMPFFPGPGLGGHCLPVDPLYLSWKLRALQYQARFIELADSINGKMPDYVVERISHALNDHAKAVRGSKILIYGVAYKPGVADVRESPAMGVIRGLLSRGAEIAYMDPLVPSFQEEELAYESLGPLASFSGYDAVVIITNHASLDRERLVREADLVVDTRNALHDVPPGRALRYGL